MIKLTQEHIEALLDKFGGEHNPPSIYLEVSLHSNKCGWISVVLSYVKYLRFKLRIPILKGYLLLVHYKLSSLLRDRKELCGIPGNSVGEDQWHAVIIMLVQQKC